jgi:hypothetical protein
MQMQVRVLAKLVAIGLFVAIAGCASEPPAKEATDKRLEDQQVHADWPIEETRALKNGWTLQSFTVLKQSRLPQNTARIQLLLAMLPVILSAKECELSELLEVRPKKVANGYAETWVMRLCGKLVEEDTISVDQQ